MSDILTNYFNNISRPKFKTLKFSQTSHDLSEYGLFLSNNNILSFTPKKCYSVLRKNNFTNYKSPFFYSEKPSKKNIIQNLSSSNNSNIEIKINEEIKINDDKTSSSIQDNNKNNIIKLKKNINNKFNKNTLLSNFYNNLKNNSIKNDFIQNNSDIKKSLNIPYVDKKLKNKKLIKELKINNDEEKKVDLIIENLLKKKITNNKKNKKIKIKAFSLSDLDYKQSTIDPMNYIEINFLENAYKPNKFKSYNMQLKVLGNQKYRNFLLEGINSYNKNYAKYRKLKSSMGYMSNNEDDKNLNKKINEMLHNKKRKLIFNLHNNNYKKNKKIVKNAFSFDTKDKKLKNRIDNLNLRLNSISKNDIEKISNYIEKNKNYISFDKKIELFLLRAQKTSNYINSRAEEYNRINQIIFNSMYKYI